MKSAKNWQEARKSFLYTHCLPEWWPALDANTRLFQFKKGAALFTEGSQVTGIYFMLNGVIKVHKKWGEDKDLIVRFARNQDILGHRGLSSESDIYPITATALSNTSLCFVSLAFFKTTLMINSEFSYRFMMFMADELQLSEVRMRNLGHMQVRGRLATALIDLEKKFGTTKEGFIGFTISRQDIAAYVGTAYETIYKLLAEFSERRLIVTEGKNIAILNKAGLQAQIT